MLKVLPLLKKACASAADIKNVRATLIPGDVVAPEVSSLIDVAEKFVVDLAVAWLCAAVGCFGT